MQFHEEQDYNKKFDASVWKQALRYAKPYRFKLLIIMLLMTFTAGIDVSFTLMNRVAIDRFITPGTSEGLGWFIALYVLLAVANSVSVWLFIRLAGWVDVHYAHDVRMAAFKKLQQLSFTYFDKTPVGYIMARMTGDTGRLGETIGWILVDLTWGLAFIMFSAITMLILSWKLALFVLAVVPPLAVVAVFLQRKILKNHRIVRKTNSRITGSFNEGITGARTTKTLVREEANLEEFKELTGSMRRASIRAATLSACFWPLVTTVGALGSAVALSRGGYQLATGVLSLGTLVAFVDYSVRFFDPIRELARIAADLQSSQAAAERVMSLIATQPDIVDSPEVIEKYGDVFAPKRENWEPLRGDVTFEHVTFRYTDAETVLDDLSLDIKAGQTIALVGETGSGKSTIVNLVCRFYEPTEGRVLIDGRDVRERSQLWLQSNLGYVLQQPHLFSGTIRENIRYGRLDATNEEVEAAARMVRADEFIHRHAACYDTEVGEGGGRLSTGEKQLISFARAILADPRIFVLDEATSSVDTETEALIQQAIQTALKGRTSFIVAHRLSTVRSADRILVIENGRIIEDGNHRQLLALRGHYWKLYTNQFRAEREAEVLGAASAAQ